MLAWQRKYLRLIANRSLLKRQHKRLPTCSLHHERKPIEATHTSAYALRDTLTRAPDERARVFRRAAAAAAATSYRSALTSRLDTHTLRRRAALLDNAMCASCASYSVVNDTKHVVHTRAQQRLQQHTSAMHDEPLHTARSAASSLSRKRQRPLAPTNTVDSRYRSRRVGSRFARLSRLALAAAVAASSSSIQLTTAMSNLVPVDYNFEFNGKHSDFAQQFYVRYLAKDERQPLLQITTRDLPPTLQKELESYSLNWSELPGLLQRALLWDAGFALTSDMEILPIYTRNGRSMAEIFVPRKAYERSGCTPKVCALPTGETFYRHKFCDGDQMARVALCAVDGARQRPHSAMWGDGGNPHFIPEVRVTRHEWTDHNDNYLMYALHTIADEVVYDKCPTVPAMVIPCAPYSSFEYGLNTSAWQAPTRSKVVEAWLKKYSDDHQENRTWLLVPLTIVVFTLLGVITIYRYKAAVRDHIVLLAALEAAAVHAHAKDTEPFLLSSSGSYSDDKSNGRIYAIDDDDDDSDSSDRESHAAATPDGELNAAAFEYFDASIGLSASAFDPLLASFNRVHPLRQSSSMHQNKRTTRKRNEVAIRSFRLFESHRLIRAKRMLMRDVVFMELLSRGASGEVWRATLHGQAVAVKQLLPQKRRQLKEMEMFMAEIYLLAQLKHPAIVSLIGIAWNTLEHIVLVQELLERGDLQQFLQSQPPPNEEFEVDKLDTTTVSTSRFTWQDQRLAIAQSIASALAYMHNLTPKLLHRDVKSRNVLLAATMDAKLCDFGISRRKFTSDELDANLTATAALGTLSWTPPELLIGDEFSEKVDIYAFGVLLTELDTCRLPYHDAQSLDLRLVQFPLRLMKAILNDGYRPRVSRSCPPLIRQLVDKCLARDQDDRPTAADICAMLAATDESVHALV